MISKIVNPQAAVVIFNYECRLNADGQSDPQAINEVMLLTKSIVSIKTSKQKARATGTFEIVLAPNKNWISTITPGSWLVVLMTKNERITTEAKTKTNEKQLKLIGRIDSVRQAVNVDSNTGARSTVFVMTGRDWGAVFDTTLYIDPALAKNGNDKLSFVGHQGRLLFDDNINSWYSNGRLPTASDVLKGIINVWGSPLELQTRIVIEHAGIQLTSSNQFMLPNKLISYLGLKNIEGKQSTSLAELITPYEGVLKTPDTTLNSGYKPVMDSFVAIHPSIFYGTHTFWQLLVEHSNPILNELVTDLRWEGGKPVFALYRRIRPFLNRENFSFQNVSGETESSAEVSNLKSLFKNVRKINIPLEDVMSINAGTNWEDRFNFIEVMPAPQLLHMKSFDNQLKARSQTLDYSSIQRDGFKPMIISSKYLPFSNKMNHERDVDYFALTNWKILLREWYFNTHLLLNGSVQFIGQDQHIQVGDNIMIDAKVLGSTGNINKKHLNNSDAYLLAHVETVDHEFAVNGNDSRSFYTVVRFVRGIITDSSGKPINNSDITVDNNASELTEIEELNHEVILTGV